MLACRAEGSNERGGGGGGGLWGDIFGFAEDMYMSPVTLLPFGLEAETTTLLFRETWSMVALGVDYSPLNGSPGNGSIWILYWFRFWQVPLYNAFL